jgi:crossover junction endodeoxyribonuclease RuvC
MRILGLDPGLRHTGWGVIEASGSRLSHVANGAVDSDKDRPIQERLLQLCEGVTRVIAEFRPAEAAIEETFVSVNGASTLKLGQARGAILLAPARAGIPVAEYPATLIKKSLVGTGHAGKQQVGMMVRMLFPGCELHGPDAADALAAAVCHAHHAATQRAWSLATAGAQ